MPRRSSKEGAVNRTKYGKYQAVFSVHGKRERRNFDTEGQARTWLQACHVGLLKDAPGAVSALDMRDAAEAKALLPEGVRLLDVVRDWLKQHGAARKMTMQVAHAAYLADLRSSGRREATITSARWIVNRLVKLAPEREVARYTTDDIRSALTALQVSDASADNYRKTWSGFFAWCVKNQAAAINPVAGLTSARKDKPLPTVLTPRQAAALLWHARDIDAEMVPYYAIGLFAGIRPQELQRLDSSAIVDGVLRLTESMTKTRQQRFVSILPVLQTWLEAYPFTGPLCYTPITHRRRHREIAQAAGLDWTSDVMRHSFASYHLARWEDAGVTSAQLGHWRPETLLRYYRSLVSKADAETYFGLVPDALVPLYTPPSNENS